jgi:hypothetical protein
MSTIVVVGGVVILGLAIWKGRKVLIKRDENGDYQLEILKLKKKVDRVLNENKKLINEIKNKDNLISSLKDSINTKGMNMKKLRGIIKKK